MPTPPPPKKSDAALDWSESILKELQNIAGLTPIPGLHEAAGIACGIVKAVNDVRSNKAAFLQLAEDAKELIFIINSHFPAESGDINLAGGLEKLKVFLVEIKEFTEERASRGRLSRVLWYKTDPGIIDNYRRRLQQSQAAFGLESHISIHENTVKIISMLEEKSKPLIINDGAGSISSFTFTNHNTGNVATSIISNSNNDNSQRIRFY